MGWLGMALLMVLWYDVLLKNNQHFGFAILLTVLVSFPIRQAYKTLSFSEVALYWTSGVLILSLVIAHFYYHEHLSWSKLAGAGLALIAIYLTGK
jgi:hypothetical protein